MIRSLIEIYQSNGIVHGLYRGMTTNYVRAVSFSVYEMMKQALNLDTGLKISTS